MAIQSENLEKIINKITTFQETPDNTHYPSEKLVKDYLDGKQSSLQIFNVKDYGAVGDGSTDDTTAIQNTIDAASAGDTIIFPNGRYKVTSTIVIIKGVSLIGIGFVKINGDFNDIIIDFDGSQGTGDSGVIGALTNVAADSIPFQLHNISIDAVTLTTTNTAQVGIRIKNSHNGIFRLGRINRCYTAILVSAESAKNTFFNRIYFNDIINCKYGIMIDRTLTDSGYVNSNFFEGGQIQTATGTGYILDGIVYSIYINGSSDGYASSGNYFNNINFQGSTTESNHRWLYLSYATSNIFNFSYAEGGVVDSTKIVLDNSINNVFHFSTGGVNPKTEISGFSTYGMSNDWVGHGLNRSVFKSAVVTPKIYGGYATTDFLLLAPTYGVGTTNADIVLAVGNSGQTEVMRIINSGNVGIGINSPTSLLHVSIAATKNKQALLIEQLDTTNNPICAEINNDGTNHGLYIHQDGVLADTKCALFIDSNAIQNVESSYLVFIRQQNASSTQWGLLVQNYGTGETAHFNSTGNGVCINLNNDGTNHGLYLHQDGILAANKYGLYVYSNAVQVNSQLIYVNQNNASSSTNVMFLINNGTGQGIYIQQVGNSTAIEIDNNGTNHGLYIHQDGVLASSKYGLYVYSNATQVNSSAYLLIIDQDNSSSTTHVAYIKNDGTGTGLLVDQYGNGYAEWIYNRGTNHGLVITQDGVLASAKYGLYVYSDAAQTAASLVKFIQDNSSSTSHVLDIQNDGSGYGLIIRVTSTNSRGILVDNDGTNTGLLLQQDGNLATGKYVLYIDNNGTPTDGAGRCIRLDGCTISSTKSPETDTEAGFIAVNIDGTQYAVPYYALS